MTSYRLCAIIQSVIVNLLINKAMIIHIIVAVVLRTSYGLSIQRSGRSTTQLRDLSTIHDASHDFVPQHSLMLASSTDLSVQLYNMQLGMSGLVERESSSSLTPLSFALLYGAGLFTALSPCAACPYSH